MKILWAVRIGNEDWQEELITENEAVIEQAKDWASKNGFDRLRVSEFNGEKPDFVATINQRSHNNKGE